MEYRKISKNIEVIKLLKKRKEIEDKIFKLDENALINYELKLLSSPALNVTFQNAFEVNKVISKFK